MTRSMAALLHVPRPMPRSIRPSLSSESTARLEGLDVRAILRRGFALCTDHDSGQMVRSAMRALAATNLRITFHDGDVVTEVKERSHERGQN